MTRHKPPCFRLARKLDYNAKTLTTKLKKQLHELFNELEGSRHYVDAIPKASAKTGELEKSLRELKMVEKQYASWFQACNCNTEPDSP